MSVSATQFEVLFVGSFGASLDEMGLALDTTGVVPVARAGDTVVSLLVVGDRGVEWQSNGNAVCTFGVYGRDGQGMQAKGENRTKLAAFLS